MAELNFTTLTVTLSDELLARLQHEGGEAFQAVSDPCDTSFLLEHFASRGIELAERERAAGGMKLF